MSKQTLTIEQMRHLQELGLDTSNASMCWLSYNEINTVLPRNFHLPTSDKDYEICDAYTLADIIEMLPSYIHFSGKNYWLEIDKENEVGTIDEYAVQYLINSEKILHRVRKTENLIDAAYEMLCWCLKNRYIETKEE